MRYPLVHYKRTQHPDYLEHYNFDGTYRGVLFRSADDGDAAMLEGRAEVDCAAIEQGFLPRGAYLVSRAGIAESPWDFLDGPKPQHRERRLESTRIRFSVGISRSGSEYITEERDQQARLANPAADRRYDSIVDAIHNRNRARRNEP